MPMNRYRLFKQLWNNRYPVKVWGKDIVPPVIKEKSIEVVDPTIPKVLEPPAWQPPVPDDARFVRYYPPKDPKTHPHWHDTPAMVFSYPGQLITGLKQAQAITNTVVYTNLPEDLEKRTADAELHPDQDELIQRLSLLAHKWYPGKDRLPKHYWPDFPKFKLRTEQGVLRNDTIRMFLHNLLHFCTVTMSQKDPALLLKRRVLYEPHIVGSFEMANADGDSRRVVINGLHAAAMSATDPLPVFSASGEVQQTASSVLPDLGPVSPFIDFESENMYPPDSTGWLSLTAPSKPLEAARYPHTLFLYNNDALWTQEDFEREPWTDDQRNARALLFTHAWCTAYAKQLFGKDVKALPRPVTAQCVQTDGESFRFLCYQLNTLEADRRQASVRNQVWIDPATDTSLFVKTILPKQFSRQATYADYESAVLKRFIAFFTNGSAELAGKPLLSKDNTVKVKQAVAQ